MLVLSAYSSWPNYEGPCDAALSVRGHVDALMADLHEIAELQADYWVVAREELSGNPSVRSVAGWIASCFHAAQLADL